MNISVWYTPVSLNIIACGVSLREVYSVIELTLLAWNTCLIPGSICMCELANQSFLFAQESVTTVLYARHRMIIAMQLHPYICPDLVI